MAGADYLSHSSRSSSAKVVASKKLGLAQRVMTERAEVKVEVEVRLAHCVPG
jgi:hypothetical protein